MTLAQTYSWIFYALGMASNHGPARASAIEQVADGINHAVPTQKEMQASLCWCVAQRLAQKEGKFYLLTDSGKALLKECSDSAGTTMGVWKNLETAFSIRGVNDSDDINPAKFTI